MRMVFSNTPFIIFIIIRYFMDCGHFISFWNWRYYSVGGRCFQRFTGCDDFRFIRSQAQDLEIIKEKVKTEKQAQMHYDTNFNF